MKYSSGAGHTLEKVPLPRKFSGMESPRGLLQGGEKAAQASGEQPLSSPYDAPQVPNDLRKEYAPKVSAGDKRQRVS
jgi:hypothetical protein